jgi:hypothetical protein
MARAKKATAKQQHAATKPAAPARAKRLTATKPAPKKPAPTKPAAKRQPSATKRATATQGLAPAATEKHVATRRAAATETAAATRRAAATAKRAAAIDKHAASNRAAATGRHAATRRAATAGKPAALSQRRAVGAKPEAAGAAEEPAPDPRVAAVAERARVAAEGPRVVLGTITVPSGKLAIFDVDLMGYLPREALEPLIITADVPPDRALPVIATRVQHGRFPDRWDHVAVALSDAAAVRARKLGEAPADFARLMCMDHAAIDHWRHDDSLDQLADFVFWGQDEVALARALGARRLPGGDGHGWIDLPLADAEAHADRAAALKAEHRWRFTADLRRHSHHEQALAAARGSGHGAGTLELAGARVLLFATGWGEGVFPVYADLDADGRAVQIRVQLSAAPRAGVGRG